MDRHEIESNGGVKEWPESSGASAVSVADVIKRFGKGESSVTALRGVTLAIPPGELTLLVGPSGCGKTTLLSIIAGIMDADEGRVEIFGNRVDTMSDRVKTRFRARNIGFVFQQYNLLPALNAAENAAVPLIIEGVARSKAVARAREILEVLGIGKKWRNLPTQLSGGQQQRVAIARALVHEPRLLVCDEPTAALDHEAGANVMKLIRDVVVRPDRAVLIVTHDNRIHHFADRVAAMDDGRIVSVEAVHHSEHVSESIETSSRPGAQP